MQRLIDANEIEELFYKQVEYGATDLMDAFDDALQDAQTIEAEPVRHGRWVCGDYYDIGDVCSECDWDSGMVNPTLRCRPNCGAKMDAKTLEEAFREMGKQAAETLKKLKEEGHA